MNNCDDALKAILAIDRTTAQRIALLTELRDELRGERAVLALLAAAKNEKTLDLRRAIFEFAVDTDITRFSDRAVFIETIEYFAVFERESTLRRKALARLGELNAISPEIEDLLVDTLINEFSLKTQRVCTAALKSCVQLKAENVQKLLGFLIQAPEPLRDDLIEILARFDATTAEDALLSMLDPAESPERRKRVLDKLAELPSLQAGTLVTLRRLVQDESDVGIQTQAIEILRDSKEMDEELFGVAFKIFTRFPDRANVLEVVRHRLASFPELVSKLTDSFQNIRSARLRTRVVGILEKTDAIEFFIEALKDENWQVRHAAIKACALHQAQKSAEIESAILDAAQDENVVILRAAMAELFLTRNQRDAETDRRLLEWIERETEPRVERVLARSLGSIPASSDNGGILLRAYQKVLTDPAFDDLDPDADSDNRAALLSKRKFGSGVSSREIVMKQLRNFAFAASDELAACLRALLWRCTTIEDVEELYARLREQEPDVGAHADLLLALFFRFVSAYPREPLSKWLGDLKNLAPAHPKICAQIPYIVRLTGATWLTSSAEKTSQKGMFLPGLMEQIRRDNWIEAGHLIANAWENRTIRKSDLLTFFKKLLRKPGEESLMQTILVMMAKGGLYNADILDLCFAYLDEFPRNGSYTYLIAGFVQGDNQDHSPMKSISEVRVDLGPARRADPHYREKVFAAFNQRGLNRYFNLLPEEMKLPPPITDWSRWEYEKWTDKGIDWCIAKMFFTLQPFDKIAALLAAPIDPPSSCARSIQHMLLLWLWKHPTDEYSPAVVDDFLRGIGALVRLTARNPALAILYDRAVLLFQMYWTRRINSPEGGRPVSPDLSELAAEVYVELCAINATFECDEAKKFPAVFPAIFQGMSSAKLKSIWRFDADSWQQLFDQYFKNADAEGQARALFNSAVQAETEARFEDAFNAYKQLLEIHEKTLFVKNLGATACYSMADCNPARRPSATDEEAVKPQHDFLLGQIQKNKFEQALRSLDRFMKRYWPTKYFQERRGELVALRKDLVAKLPSAGK